MSGKNQFPFQFNWQSPNPQTGFVPSNGKFNGGSLPSGTLTGAMASTNVIYTNILDISRMDNSGIEVVWTGTPTGTLLVVASISGLNWFSLTFNPALAQPAGSANTGYGININQYPFKFLMLQYTNASSTGTLSAWTQLKDLN